MIPKVSVIIPYYNAEKWLGRCTDSLGQQDGEFEFILVSDHCTDGSDKIARAFAERDQRASVVWNLRHKGVSGARNTGLDEAQGEWVTFLDADDEYLPDAMRKFMIMAERATASIHQANHIRHNPDKGTTRRQFANPEGIYATYNMPEAWCSVWNKLYARELLQEIRFDEEMQYGEDEIFNLECLNKAPMIHCSDVDIVQHNIGTPGSLTKIRTGEDLIRQLIKLAEFIRDHRRPVIRRLAYNMLNVHLNSPWYSDEICGE